MLTLLPLLSDLVVRLYGGEGYCVSLLSLHPAWLHFFPRFFSHPHTRSPLGRVALWGQVCVKGARVVVHLRTLTPTLTPTLTLIHLL